jgi:hypothetical protein
MILDLLGTPPPTWNHYRKREFPPTMDGITTDRAKKSIERANINSGGKENMLGQNLVHLI